jgi:hypothetical protein
MKKLQNSCQLAAPTNLCKYIKHFFCTRNYQTLNDFFIFQTKRNSFTHSDNGRLAKLIIQFDKKGVVTSASWDSGTKKRKDKVWAQVHKAYNVKNENSPVDLESLKVNIFKYNSGNLNTVFLNTVNV